jgi:ABC-2 type transport system permease protein
VMIPFVPVLPVIALIIAGVPATGAALLPLPIMCLFLGWTIHNDVAYDSTAVWLHVASGTRGLADRIGRLVPVLFIGIPLIAVGSIITVAVNGDWSLVPPVIGVSSAVLLVGIGLSSLSSSVFPYPATKPNDSPFAQPQNTGATAALIQSFSFIAILAFSSPVVVLAVLALMGQSEWLLGSLIAGLAVGVVVLVAGVLGGAAVFNRRGPEIMAAAVRAD